MSKFLKDLWTEIEVSDIILETWDTKTYCFVNKDKKKPFSYFKPGQYITIKKVIDGESIARSYTISSSNHEDFISLTIKRQPNGIMSNWMFENLKIGDTISSTKPLGSFFYDPSVHKKNLFFLCGGSGVTPAMSILREYSKPGLSDAEKPDFIKLVVCYKTLNDVIFRNELESLRKNIRIDIDIYLTFEDVNGFKQGIYDKEKLLNDSCDKLNNYTFFTCGPKGLMNMFVDTLKEANVPQEHILIENFS